MNLAIRGISANLGEMAANTFTHDQHKDLKADFIMASPPFNQKQWRAENELVDDPRWNGYEAVSYTHLDVYKRQVTKCVCLI